MRTAKNPGFTRGGVVRVQAQWAVNCYKKAWPQGTNAASPARQARFEAASTGTPSVRMATDRQKRAKAAAARQKAARSQKVAKKRNILDRLGASTSTKVVTVRGVGPTVSAVEVRDLFASVGAVDRVTSSLGANTSSTTYEIAFRTPSKARAAVAEFDGRALDGRPLRVALKGGAPAAAAARVVVDVAAKAARTARPSKPVVVDLGGPRRPKKQKGKTAVRRPPKSKRSPPKSKSRLDQGAAGRLIQAALR